MNLMKKFLSALIIGFTLMGCQAKAETILSAAQRTVISSGFTDVTMMSDATNNRLITGGVVTPCRQTDTYYRSFVAFRDEQLFAGVVCLDQSDTAEPWKIIVIKNIR
jgi:uncharacterized lipoprotein NlpE involved in copper resistance